MAGEEGQPNVKKQTDADREKALNELKAMRERRLETSRPSPQPNMPPSQQRTVQAPPAQRKVENENLDLTAPRKEDDEAAIAAVRASRMQAEAYHDVTVLRKRAHAHQHKAAKFQTKSKSFESKAQKSITRAVTYREKAGDTKEGVKDLESRLRDYEKDLSMASAGAVEPEKIRLKMSKLERKKASLQERARKFEAKAAMQNERAANYRSKAAFNLEQAKIHEAEVKNFTKRADNLEKAGL